jgi:hypothetical protein
MAFRSAGGEINPLPNSSTVKITTGGWGPDNAEKHVDETVEKLLAQPTGWMVYNLHGLDEEGWGPIRPAYLERLLARLTNRPPLLRGRVGRHLGHVASKIAAGVFKVAEEIVLPFIQFPQPCIEVPPELGDLQVWPDAEQLA